MLSPLLRRKSGTISPSLDSFKRHLKTKLTTLPRHNSHQQSIYVELPRTSDLNLCLIPVPRRSGGFRLGPGPQIFNWFYSNFA